MIESASDAALIAEIISRPAAYGVDLFGMLSVEPLESGIWAVRVWNPALGTLIEESVFDTPIAAAERFVEMRREKKLGFDHETGGTR